MQVLTKFGIATLVIGGLTGLAYLERDGPAGQAIAIGSGVAFGATLGVGTALFAGENPYEKSYLALPLALLGAVGGGVITVYLRQPRRRAIRQRCRSFGRRVARQPESCHRCCVTGEVLVTAREMSVGHKTGQLFLATG